MFKYFFKTAIRAFLREKMYTLLNIIGLAIGIAVALIILLYLQQDLTFDKYHKNAKNIYRVNSIYTASGKETKFALSPVAFGPRIKEELPEVKAYVRLSNTGRRKIKNGEKELYENIYVADSGLFDIFTHEFLQGDPITCFRYPNSIVLSESLAGKLFGKNNPVGATLILDQSLAFQVSAIIKDLPENLHLRYEALIPTKYYDPNGDLKNAHFYDVKVYTYLLFPENYDVQEFNEKFPAFFDKYAAKRGQAMNQQYKAVLQPMLDIHFTNEWSHDLPTGNKTYTFAFLVIGILVIFLSCINYINMTTARADTRTKEIAVKKVLGSGRSNLVVQFLGESLILTIIGMIIALATAQFILEFTNFSQLIDKDLAINLKSNIFLLISIPIVILLVGIISGLYPAFYLAATESVRSALVRRGLGKSVFSFRKILVVFQMVISIGVIICTLVIDNQIKYVRSKDIGLNRENLLILPLRDSLVYNHFTAFKSNLLQKPDIVSVSSAWTVPAWGHGNLIYRVETEKGMEEINIVSMWASYDFIKTTGIKLLEGRDYDQDNPSDYKSAFIINESLAKKMGWDEPIGKHLQQNFNENGVPFFDGYVIGVVADYNFESLHNAVKPMVLRLQSNEGGCALIKVSGKEMSETLKYIESTWHKFAEDFPSDFTFLDKNYVELYKKDQQQNMLVKVLSLISIVISCIGLLSIASYITKIRNKEIVIRKVYGAPVRKITFMLYREITLLVAVSAIISIPLSYWLTEKLLNNFAYKAGFNPFLALITVTGVILLTISIVSWHSIKASYSNPARFLKME